MASCRSISSALPPVPVLPKAHPHSKRKMINYIQYFSILSLSAHRENNNNHYDGNYDDLSRSMDRRKMMHAALMAVATTTTSSSILGMSKPSWAACLSGDTSEDCIGVYKMPIDDAVLSYVETPEILKKFAPDVRWVPQVQSPKNYADAYQDLNNMYMKSCDLEKWVLTGNLTKAGVDILEIVPRVTVSGRVIVSQLRQLQPQQGASLIEVSNSGSLSGEDQQDWSMKSYRVDVALYELLILLGQTDIMLGQGLNGQLGALTAAQIQILQEVKDVKNTFTDLMKAIPDPSDVTPVLMKQKRG
eukprot:CAMPEP_0195308314 /NCGR_PEP_ID=MMETSP0707-20130614/38162_1 /TAXON_ID=33640 /ORGANISM="Asterionellopsis glacialis, Strain CCMP134" /LENGTH=301 /DNA_ID=CAMNT_0040372579 /DNA_START=439 /DNA_END=1347 /DNA_ORIENTATION=-